MSGHAPHTQLGHRPALVGGFGLALNNSLHNHNNSSIKIHIYIFFCFGFFDDFGEQRPGRQGPWTNGNAKCVTLTSVDKGTLGCRCSCWWQMEAGTARGRRAKPALALCHLRASPVALCENSNTPSLTFSLLASYLFWTLAYASAVPCTAPYLSPSHLLPLFPSLPLLRTLARSRSFPAHFQDYCWWRDMYDTGRMCWIRCICVGIDPVNWQLSGSGVSSPKLLAIFFNSRLSTFSFHVLQSALAFYCRSCAACASRHKPSPCFTKAFYVPRIHLLYYITNICTLRCILVSRWYFHKTVP